MKNFQIIRALSSKSAVSSIAKENSAMFIAGGTNLVDLMKKNVVAPDKLIDINGIDLKKIEFLTEKVSIGALAKNSEVAEDKTIKERYPLLALALAAGASTNQAYGECRREYVAAYPLLLFLQYRHAVQQTRSQKRLRSNWRFKPNACHFWRFR